MKKAGRIISIPLLCIAMVSMIFDSKTAILGAQDGLELCVQTVVPSLFPFMVISTILTNALIGYNLPIIKQLARFCKMAPGTEGLLFMGLVGGYPVGAKCVYDSWKSGQISKADASRYLGFCSNAGPAFIFGICGSLFQNQLDVWFLWGIHILSALLVGRVINEERNSAKYTVQKSSVSFQEAIKNAANAMTSVCIWVVLFRVIIAFLRRWLLWLLSTEWRSLCEGILELTNGCATLFYVHCDGIKFLLCAMFLGFGGLCVALQTVSVVGELGTGMYFPGKIIQGIISAALAGLYASLRYHICSPAIPLVAMIVLITLAFMKKTVDFPRRFVYNEENYCEGENQCYSVRKLQSPAAIVPVEQKSMTNKSFALKEVLYPRTPSAASSYTTLASESPLSPRQ